MSRYLLRALFGAPRTWPNTASRSRHRSHTRERLLRVFADPHRYLHPKPYEHKRGCIKWVCLQGGGKSGGTWNTLPQSCQLLIVQFLATIVDLPVFVSSHRCAAILLANAAASQNLSASVKICQSKQAVVLKPSFGCTDRAWDLFRSRCLSIHEPSHHVTVDGKSFIPLTTVVDGMAFLPLFFDGCDFLLSFLKTAAAVEPWSPNRGTVKPWGGAVLATLAGCRHTQALSTLPQQFHATDSKPRGRWGEALIACRGSTTTETRWS